MNARLSTVMIALCACSDRSADPPHVAPPPAPVITIVVDAPVESDAAAEISLDDALAALRALQFSEAAHTIAKRVTQPAPKMKLSQEEARAAATGLLAVVNRPPITALHAVMPRSTVELARAVAERGVSVTEADTIARYLVSVVQTLDFERRETFDENHSHVTGREWHEIDYSGEGMTWQQQKADWTKQGVENFKTAGSIHAYFTGAEKLPHWKRVYRPRGAMASIAAPTR